MTSPSAIQKKFNFTIPKHPISTQSYTAEYVDKLLHAGSSENGKKGYHVTWRDGNRTGITGYLLADVKKCIDEGIWVIVDEKNEKEKN